MSSATAQVEPNTKAPRPQRLITLQEFLRHYSDKEDGYKYELNNGVIEKSSAMNQHQTKIFFLLSRLFLNTRAFKSGGGLISESAMTTAQNQLRRPDIAYYSGEQISKMLPGSNHIAPWVAEVVSPTDNVERINEMKEVYFKAGVQVVWLLYPSSKEVYVYTAPDKVTICRGKTMCSGTPVMPDFEISADELFA